MKWVHPEFLFALAVLIIPLLIHLFHFRKYKTIYFSSLTFVKNIEQEQKNPRKIKHLIILILRMLAFAAFVIAFAQPYFPGKKELSKNQIVGIYIDNSYSMSRIGQNGELLNQAKQIVEHYSEQAPRNTQFVLFTNELSGSEKQVLNAQKLLDNLEKITYSPLRRSQTDILRFWSEAQLLYPGSKASNALVYLSDFQQINFRELTTKYKQQGILAPILLKPVDRGNLYVDTCWFDSPVQRLGAQQRIGIRITNSGDKSVENAVVNVKIGTNNRDLFTSIPANGSDTVFLDYFNQKSGEIAGAITINDKQMNQDDAFYFNYVCKAKGDVLIINGPDAVKNVGVVFGLDSFYSISEKDDQSSDQLEFNAYDLIVLNGLNQIGSSLTSKLSEFAAADGTLFLIPGTNSAQGGWNNLLQKLQLPTMNGTETVGLSIQKINLEDPFFEGVFERKPSKIGLPLVSKSYRLDKQNGTLSTDLLSYQNGSPFFVKGTGKNKCYLLATALSPEYSAFVSNQLFSTLLLHVGALSQRQAPLFLTLGKDVYYPIESVNNNDEPIHLKKGPLDFIPLTFQRNNKSYISIQGNEALHLLEPGIFHMEKSTKKLGEIAINTDRMESDVTNASIETCTNYFKRLGFLVQSVQDGSTWNGAGIIQVDDNSTLWKWFIFIGLLALLGEMFIVVFYKR